MSELEYSIAVQRVRTMKPCEVAVAIGWAQSRDTVEEVQWRLRDVVVEALGDRRWSDVTYRIIGPAEARRLLTDLRTHPMSGLTAELDDRYAQLQLLVGGLGGVIVVARADGARP